MDTFLAYIGVNPVDLFAGFTGGICAALVTTGSRPSAWNMLVAIIVGTGVGSYGGPVLPPLLGVKPSGFATFAVGAGGLPITKGLIWAAGRIRFSPAGDVQQGEQK